MPRLRRSAQPGPSPSRRASSEIHEGNESDAVSASSSGIGGQGQSFDASIDERSEDGQPETRVHDDGIYRPERMRYPIYIFRFGEYRLNLLSEPLTIEQMEREMPRLRFRTIMFLVMPTFIIGFAVLASTWMLRRWFPSEA